MCYMEDRIETEAELIRDYIKEDETREKARLEEARRQETRKEEVKIEETKEDGTNKEEAIAGGSEVVVGGETGSGNIPKRRKSREPNRIIREDLLSALDGQGLINKYVVDQIERLYQQQATELTGGVQRQVPGGMVQTQENLVANPREVPHSLVGAENLELLSSVDDSNISQVIEVVNQDVI